MRNFVLAGAAGLALLPPGVALGAPVGGLHAMPVARPVSQHAIEARSAGGDAFKIPMHFDGRPKSAVGTEPNLLPYHWREWRAYPRYLSLQPTWYQTGCLANNSFEAARIPSDDGTVLPGTKIGDLVDDRSRHLFDSPSSYDSSLSLTKSLAPTFEPTSCGASSTIDL